MRAVVTVAPHCYAGQDRQPPVSTTPWPKAISFPLISPLIMVQYANQSLYSMFALLHGSSTVTRDGQCVCCMRSNHNLYVYTFFFELLLNCGILLS